MSVYWLLSASESLRAALHGYSDETHSDTDQVASWTDRINGVLVDVFPGQIVLIRDYLQGYRAFYGLVVLMIETQPTAGAAAGRFLSPGTYIVKVAFDKKREVLRHEIEAWNNARPKHVRSDNVFVSLEAHPDDQNPTALVYGDANVVLGQRNIITLEDAISQSCRFGVPVPESIDRVLRTLYERMSKHFFPHSHLERASVYLHADRPRLKDTLNRYDEHVVPGEDPEYRHDLRRRRHRRETLGLLSGDHEYFTDPIDLLAGLERSNDGPEILRGTAHGDLHGRNVQVSIVNDEASQCAVYDYEKFHTGNFPAWDFIKLEIETAVRLLDRFGDPDMENFTRQCLRFWRHVATRTVAFDRKSTPSIPAELQLPGVEWVRLADRLVQLRIMASENLGPNRGRVYEWLDEYELLLTWYAARAGLYPNYEQRWTVAAFVAAGVAARRLMQRLPAEIELSHRRRFLAARTLARSSDGDRMIEGCREFSRLIQEYPHVLEIREEQALVLIKLGKYPEAEVVLGSITESYDHTTAETPSRWGSLWKRRAYAVKPLDDYALERALTWYQRAVDREPTNFYPRINVATLLLILGRRDQARQEATRTLENLDQSTEHTFWWGATRGEVMLHLGKDFDEALEHYRRAVRDQACQPEDRKTMHDQLQLLRPHWPSATQNQLTDEVLVELFSGPHE